MALYTDTFPEDGHRALDIRKIPKKRIRYLLPSVEKDYSNDPRFYDCWSKLTPFSLVEYDRVVQLDSDMLVLKNMDDLMDLELDPVESAGKGERIFAASHACVCNPMKKPHYPKNWYGIAARLYDIMLTCVQDTCELRLYNTTLKPRAGAKRRTSTHSRLRHAKRRPSGGQSFQGPL